MLIHFHGVPDWLVSLLWQYKQIAKSMHSSTINVVAPSVADRSLPSMRRRSYMALSTLPSANAGAQGNDSDTAGRPSLEQLG